LKEEHSIKNLLFNNYKEKLNASGSESVYTYVLNMMFTHSLIVGIIMVQLQRTG